MRSPFFAFIQRHKQLLPLLLLTVYCISALASVARETVVLDGVTYGISLTAKHYLAFGAIALNFLVYFRFRKFYKYTLALTILAGLFGFMVFPLRDTLTGVGVDSLLVMVQPSAFLAGLLAYILNFRRINNALWGLLQRESDKGQSDTK